MLALIHTEPARPSGDPPPRRRLPRPNWRLLLPWAGAALCLVLAGLVPPLPGFVLVMVALALFLDGALALWPRDGLRNFRL